MTDKKNLSKIQLLAAKVSGQSPLCVGRVKLETEKITSYPALTMRDFDFISYVEKATGEAVEYPVIIFDEIDDGFYCGGMALYDLCKAIAEDDELVKELNTNGIKMKFTKTKTKGGNTYVNFTVLD